MCEKKSKRLKTTVRVWTVNHILNATQTRTTDSSEARLCQLVCMNYHRQFFFYILSKLMQQLWKCTLSTVQWQKCTRWNTSPPGAQKAFWTLSTRVYLEDAWYSRDNNNDNKKKNWLFFLYLCIRVQWMCAVCSHACLFWFSHRCLSPYHLFPNRCVYALHVFLFCRCLFTCGRVELHNKQESPSRNSCWPDRLRT